MKKLMLYIYFFSTIVVLDFDVFKINDNNIQHIATKQINKVHADPGGTN